MSLRFLELNKYHKKKIKLTLRMALFSLGFLTLTLLINELRYLFRLKKGSGVYNFAFKFSLFLPTTVIALILGLAITGKTIKHWKNWTNLKKKWLLIGLGFPAIRFWIHNISRMVLMPVDKKIKRVTITCIKPLPSIK